jgi:hypothetical protein
MPVALLPVSSPKQRAALTAAKKEEAKTRRDYIYSSTMAYLLHYITDAVDGYYAQCADGKVTHCFPRLAA